MSSNMLCRTGTNNPGGSSQAVGVMVVSPNLSLRQEMICRLSSGRWSVEQASSGAEALQRLESSVLDLVLLDQALPDLRADEFTELLQLQHPAVEIVPINPHTGQPIVGNLSPGSAAFELVQQMSRGGTLPPASTLPHSLEEPNENQTLSRLPGMVGTSPQMRRVASMVRLVAQRETTVLITGESGTGKDMVARALHQIGPRRLKPFVVINCAAIPEHLLEAELFGYVKGAFTGAVQSRIGRIHAAHGGTLFLDEVSEMPLGLQSKLLRFLEQGELQRLGTTDIFTVDVRVIAVTNSDLHKAVQEHGFRGDLFYRLSVFPIELAPLRDRMEDLSELARTFLNKYCPRNVSLSLEAESLLMQHSWPGNVRELRNVIERASILLGSGNSIEPEHLVL